MIKKKELLNTRRELKLYFLKKLYEDAFYWHLIHKGHTMEQAELEVIVQMQK